MAATLAMAGCGGSGEGPDGSAARGRPNVVFIVVDDLGTQLGAWGHDRVRSPNLDDLAARGARFARAYCQYPLCNPSRASFLTGLLPETNGVIRNNIPPDAELEDVVLLPEYFRQAGYRIQRVGKIQHSKVWEEKIAWDDTPNTWKPVGRSRKVPEDVQRSFLRRRKKSSEKLSWSKVSRIEGRLLPDAVIVDHASRLIRRYKDERPFFMAVGLSGPHLPFEAPEQFYDLYPTREIRAPKSADDEAVSMPEAALQRARQLTIPKRKHREAQAAYYAAVSFADAMIGRLVRAIDKAGLSENTLFVVLSDHGYHLGEHGGLWGKWTLFEEAAHVPLIVAGAGVPSGVVVNRPVELIDVFPTMLELAGLPPADFLQGESVVPWIREPETPSRKGALTVLTLGNRFAYSLRTERYRYTEWPTGERELYDHRRDPEEVRNLAESLDHEKRRDQMANRLRASRRRGRVALRESASGGENPEIRDSTNPSPEEGRP